MEVNPLCFVSLFLNFTFPGFYVWNLPLNIKMRLLHWELWLHCQQLKLCARNRKLWFQIVAFVLYSSEAAGRKGVSNNRSQIQTRFQWSVHCSLRATWWPVHNKKKKFILLSQVSLFHVLSNISIIFFCALRKCIQHHKCYVLILIRNSFTILNRERLGTVFVLQGIKVTGKSPPVQLQTAYS